MLKVMIVWMDFCKFHPKFSSGLAYLSYDSTCYKGFDQTLEKSKFLDVKKVCKKKFSQEIYFGAHKMRFLQ